jgi:hypothetical protein
VDSSTKSGQPPGGVRNHNARVKPLRIVTYGYAIVVAEARLRSAYVILLGHRNVAGFDWIGSYSQSSRSQPISAYQPPELQVCDFKPVACPYESRGCPEGIFSLNVRRGGHWALYRWTMFALNWLDWIFLGTFYIILRYCHFHSRMSSVLSPVKLTLSSQKAARSRIIGIPDSPILAAPFEQDPTFAGAMRRSVPLALCHVYMPSVAARRSSGCLVLLLAMETDRKLLKNMEKNNFHQAQKSQIKIYQATGVEKTIGAYWNQIMSFQ